MKSHFPTALAQDRSAAKVNSRKGLFCRRYCQGEIVMTRATASSSRFPERITPGLGPVRDQIGDDLFIAPVTQEERKVPCSTAIIPATPTRPAWQYYLRRLRDIRAEEDSHDWCTRRRQLKLECRGRPIAAYFMARLAAKPECKHAITVISLLSLPIRLRHAR